LDQPNDAKAEETGAEAKYGPDETECLRRAWISGELSVYIPAEQYPMHKRGSNSRGWERRVVGTGAGSGSNPAGQ
jgi:hypothetical protein